MPDDSPVSRGKFLRSLGSSVTGMALGTGIGIAAQVLASKVAAAFPETAAAMPTPATGKKPDSAFDPFICGGSAEGNRIALTFDDGPTPGVTERILDELKKRNVLATFFMIGQKVAAEPDLVRRVAGEGHEIGNHTFSHPNLNSLPDQQVRLEIQQAQDIITNTIKIRPTYFRPPFLAFRRNQAPLAQDMGLSIIYGNNDSRDWSQPGEGKITDAILSQAKCGYIIICHDLHVQTANCIGPILDNLHERGLCIAKMSSFLAPSPQGT
jgi:peptidoglycan/xylan/chitin deacetylase (PgdA/CDA1 family)